MPKQLLNQNWLGSGLGKHPKYFGIPSYFCNNSPSSGPGQQPQYFGTPAYFYNGSEDSDFKFGIQLGWREYDTKTTFTTKNGMVWAWEHPTNLRVLPSPHPRQF